MQKWGKYDLFRGSDAYLSFVDKSDTQRSKKVVDKKNKNTKAGNWTQDLSRVKAAS